MDQQEIFNSVKAQLKRHRSNQTGTALLAISGGLDSMTLWYIYRALDLPHLVAHMNFNLRGEESDQDQKLVELTAARYRVDCLCKSVDAENYAAENKLGIQEAARELRYKWFNELMDEERADHLVTAHHLDDSVETFLINLDRGSGLAGLGGISSSEKLLRPMIELSREQIEAFARDNKIDHRTDSSNLKEDYFRNWIRHKVVSPWKEKHPQFIHKMRGNLQRLQKANELLELYLQQDQEQMGWLKQKKWPRSYPLKQLKEHALPLELLYNQFSPFGFNYSQMEDLYQAITDDKVGAAFYAGKLRLILDRHQLLLDKMKLGEQSPVKIERATANYSKPRSFKVELVDPEPIDLNEKNAHFLDADKVEFPLELRRWKEGDLMRPLGMKGRKKISDILIDEKRSLPEKEDSWVLVSNSQIVCLLGYRIADTVKMTDSTLTLMKIKWSA